MFENFEFDPITAGMALVGGIFAVIVMSRVDVGIIWKIGSFLATTAVCYFMVQKIRGTG